MPSSLDIDDILNRASLTVEPPETDDERSARLRREEREHRAMIVQGYVVFFAVVATIVLIGLLCGYEELLDQTASADTRKWAQTALTALLSGSLSFVAGKAIGKSSK